MRISDDRCFVAQKQRACSGGSVYAGQLKLRKKVGTPCVHVSDGVKFFDEKVEICYHSVVVQILVRSQICPVPCEHNYFLKTFQKKLNGLNQIPTSKSFCACPVQLCFVTFRSVLIKSNMAGLIRNILQCRLCSRFSNVSCRQFLTRTTLTLVSKYVCYYKP